MFYPLQLFTRMHVHMHTHAYVAVAVAAVASAVDRVKVTNLLTSKPVMGMSRMSTCSPGVSLPRKVLIRQSLLLRNFNVF